MAAHAAPLPQLVIDPAETTVSGLSSGGYMAVQMHVAFSATFRKGAGVVAGGPFYCAEGSIVHATGRCMAHNTSIPVGHAGQHDEELGDERLYRPGVQPRRIEGLPVLRHARQRGEASR